MEAQQKNKMDLTGLQLILTLHQEQTTDHLVELKHWIRASQGGVAPSSAEMTNAVEEYDGTNWSSGKLLPQYQAYQNQSGTQTALTTVELEDPSGNECKLYILRI